MTPDNACTIVSLVPFTINEEKPGLIPSSYRIPAAKPDSIEILVVNEASYPLYLDAERGTMRVTVPSAQVAKSFCEDYCRAQLGRDEDAEPGLFFVPGTHTKESIVKGFPELLRSAAEKQRRWFLRLVRIADDDWSRYRQHKMISDTQRFAAKALGLEREWAMTVEHMPKTISCPACFSFVDNRAVICPNCKLVLDETRHKALKFA